MELEITQRQHLTEKLLRGIQDAMPDSRTLLRGSLAVGNADQYSDIDLLD